MESYDDYDKTSQKHCMYVARTCRRECYRLRHKIKKKVSQIINCKNLDLELYASRSLINYYIGLRNQTLVLNHNYFDVNDLRMLIEVNT